MTRHAATYYRRRDGGLCVDCGEAPPVTYQVRCAGCKSRREIRRYRVRPAYDHGAVCAVRTPRPRQTFVAIVEGRALLHEVMWPP